MQNRTKNFRKESIHNPDTSTLVVLVSPISFFEVCIFLCWDQLLPAFTFSETFKFLCILATLTSSCPLFFLLSIYSCVLRASSQDGEGLQGCFENSCFYFYI